MGKSCISGLGGGSPGWCCVQSSPHGVSPACVPVSQQPSGRCHALQGHHNGRALYLPPGAGAAPVSHGFCWREQCVDAGDPAAMRRMRVLRGEGLAGGWGLMPAGGSVHPSRVLGAVSPSPLILLPGTSERALAPSSPCPPWGSWGPLRDDLARPALVGAAQPQPSWPLLTRVPCPSPAQAQGPCTGAPVLQCSRAPARCCRCVTGEARMGPVPQGGLPSAAVRGRLPLLIPLTALLPVQSSTGC